MYHDCGRVNRLGVLAKSPLLVHKCFLQSRCTLFVKASEKYVFSQQSSVLLQQRERLGSRWLVCTLRLSSTLACTLSSTLSSATSKRRAPSTNLPEKHIAHWVLSLLCFSCNMLLRAHFCTCEQECTPEVAHSAFEEAKAAFSDPSAHF